MAAGADKLIFGVLSLGHRSYCQLRGRRVQYDSGFDSWHSMTEDRRVATRRQLSGPARVLLDGGRSVAAHAHDVAAGGMAMLMAEPLAPGQACVIVFAVPSERGPRPMTASAQVRHGVPADGSSYRIGLQFTDIDGICSWAIQEFVLRPPDEAAASG
jgi:hypothetical protein